MLICRVGGGGSAGFGDRPAELLVHSTNKAFHDYLCTSRKSGQVQMLKKGD